MYARAAVKAKPSPRVPALSPSASRAPKSIANHGSARPELCSTRFEHDADRVASWAAQSMSGNVYRYETAGEEKPPAASPLPRAGLLRSAGDPLPRQVRRPLERSLGHDFSQVRVHADAKAAELADAYEARAFTIGRDVVFGKSEFSPTTPDGQRLIAHELVHVVQQRASPALASGPLDAGFGDVQAGAPFGTVQRTPREPESAAPYRADVNVNLPAHADVNHAHDIEWISAEAKKERASENETLGLTEMNLRINWHASTWLTPTSSYLTAFRLWSSPAELHIYVAKELSTGSCEYNSVLRHERHHEADFQHNLVDTRASLRENATTWPSRAHPLPSTVLSEADLRTEIGDWVNYESWRLNYANWLASCAWDTLDYPRQFSECVGTQWAPGDVECGDPPQEPEMHVFPLPSKAHGEGASVLPAVGPSGPEPASPEPEPASREMASTGTTVITAVAADRPGGATETAPGVPPPAAARATALLVDEDRRVTRPISKDDPDFVANYIDLNIATADYWDTPFASQDKRYRDFWLNYSDGRRLQLNLDDVYIRHQLVQVPGSVTVRIAIEPPQYVKRGGFIYPLLFNNATTPTITDVATTITYNHQRREQFLEVATLTFQFAMILTAYATPPELPEAPERGSPFRRPLKLSGGREVSWQDLAEWDQLDLEVPVEELGGVEKDWQAGGHTLGDHVYVSDAALQARAQKGPVPITKFDNPDVAVASINKALEENGTTIESWAASLKGEGKPQALQLKVTMPDPVGYGYRRLPDGSLEPLQGLRNVRVVLQSHGTTSWVVRTAFPAL